MAEKCATSIFIKNIHSTKIEKVKKIIPEIFWTQLSTIQDYISLYAKPKKQSKNRNSSLNFHFIQTTLFLLLLNHTADPLFFTLSHSLEFINYVRESVHSVFLLVSIIFFSFLGPKAI